MAIITVPGVPILGPDGDIPRPAILIFGEGGWRVRTARELETSAGSVVVSGFTLAGAPHCAVESNLFYADAADVILIWVGEVMGDALRLMDWAFAGYLLGSKFSDKLVLGVHPQSEHPMAPGLACMAQVGDLRVAPSLEEAVTAARWRLAELRRGI